MNYNPFVLSGAIIFVIAIILLSAITLTRTSDISSQTAANEKALQISTAQLKDLVTLYHEQNTRIVKHEAAEAAEAKNQAAETKEELPALLQQIDTAVSSKDSISIKLAITKAVQQVEQNLSPKISATK